MTVEELLVFNSTIPPNGGTVLEHLLNIAVARDAWCSAKINVKDDVTADVVYDIITVDFKDIQLEHSSQDGIEININSDTVGVDI